MYKTALQTDPQEAPSGARTQHVLNGDVITNDNMNDSINQDDKVSIFNNEDNEG